MICTQQSNLPVAFSAEPWVPYLVDLKLCPLGGFRIRGTASVAIRARGPLQYQGFEHDLLVVSFCPEDVSSDPNPRCP